MFFADKFTSLIGKFKGRINVIPCSFFIPSRLPDQVAYCTMEKSHELRKFDLYNEMKRFIDSLSMAEL